MPQVKAHLESPTDPTSRSSGDGSPDRAANTDRIAALETALATIQHTLDIQFKRMAAMQAEIDRLTAK